jgi:hypothetical protein
LFYADFPFSYSMCFKPVYLGSASFHQKGVLLLFLLVSAIVLFRIASAERARFDFGADRNKFNVGNLTDNFEVHPSDTMSNIGKETKPPTACPSVGRP